MKKRETFGDRAADLITKFVGSWKCAGFHTLWFTLWFTLRLDINLLTLIVSLEAIFLCIFLLMSGNRQSEKDRAKAEQDLQIDTKAELLIEKMLWKIIKQGEHLDSQDHMILKIIKHLQVEIESELPTQSIPAIEEKTIEIPAWAQKPGGLYTRD